MPASHCILRFYKPSRFALKMIIKTLYLLLIVCYGLYLVAVTIIPFLLLALKDFPVVKLFINETRKGKSRLQLMIEFYSLQKAGAFIGIMIYLILFLILQCEILPVYVHYSFVIIGWLLLFCSCWRANKKISLIVENCLTYFGRV